MAYGLPQFAPIFGPGSPVAGSTPSPTPTPTPSPTGSATPATPGGTFAPTLPQSTFDPLNPDLAGRPIFIGAINHQLNSDQYSVDTVPAGGGKGQGSYQTLDAPTAGQFMQRFANWSISDKSQFIDMQNRLFKAGFYGSHQPAKGAFTVADQQAMMTALSGYVSIVNNGTSNGITFDQYLASVIAGGGLNGGGGGPTRAPLQLTDPTQLEGALQQASQSALGRDLSKSELSHFVAAFHGLERNAYNQAGAGHTVTPPDISGQAKNAVDTRHAAEEGQRLQATYMDVIDQLLNVK